MGFVDWEARVYDDWGVYHLGFGLTKAGAIRDAQKKMNRYHGVGVFDWREEPRA